MTKAEPPPDALPACIATRQRGARATAILLLSALPFLPAAPARANLVIDVAYDSSVTSLSNATAIETAFGSVVSNFEAVITNNVTVNLDVAWGKINNNVALPQGDVAGSADSLYGTAYNYSQVASLLSGLGSTLPSTDPTGGLNYYLPAAEAKALGVNAATNPAVDGYIGFGDTAQGISFALNDTNGVTAGTYDFTAAADHEVEETLGRISALTSSAAPFYAMPLDVFRYTAPNTNSFVYNTPNGGVPAYASVDGGKTDLGTYNNATSGGDRGDWQTVGSSTSDAQNAFSSTGKKQGLSTSDEDLLHGLGWNFISNATGLFKNANQPTGASANVQPPVNAPEPSTLSVVALAAAALGSLRRRRRR